MHHTLSLPLGSRPVLRAAAVSALLIGSALPAAAQVLIYEGQPGLAPRGYPVPPGAYPPGTYPGGAYGVPQARYPVLPPEEIRSIVQSMGYWSIGAPKLSGRFYLVAASDQEGRALLRVNAFTGRVVSARAIPGGPGGPGGPAMAAPAPAPQRQAPPATARAVPPAPAPSYSAPSPTIAGTPAPLPPQRPPEATMAAVTPAPAVVAPAAPEPAAVAAQPTPGASANAPAGQTAAQQSANAAPSATPASPAQPQKRKAGAGTATTDSASAGTASVLSRPKGQ